MIRKFSQNYNTTLAAETFEDSSYSESIHMDRERCEMRSKFISDVNYDLKLNLPRGTYFSGYIEITFTVLRNNLMTQIEYIPVDFRGIRIASLEVNGAALRASSTTFEDHQVRLPVHLLRPGCTNSVKMYFLNAYRTDGVGLVSFIDKSDSQQYIKTQFETDFCHMIFPCFDQPDLMARLQLSCQTEADWTVIANGTENENASEEQYADLSH